MKKIERLKNQLHNINAKREKVINDIVKEKNRLFFTVFKKIYPNYVFKKKVIKYHYHGDVIEYTTVISGEDVKRFIDGLSAIVEYPTECYFEGCYNEENDIHYRLINNKLLIRTNINIKKFKLKIEE